MLKKIYDKRYGLPVVYTIFSALQVLFIFLEDQASPKYKLNVLFITLGISIALSMVYIIFLKYFENRKRSIKSGITEINCFFGDIFNSNNGLTIIPFDSSYDLNCNPNLIPKKSIQAQFINKIKKKNKFDRLESCIDDLTPYEKDYGKVFSEADNRYLLFPVVKLNSNGNAEISLLEYIQLIDRLCKTIESNSKKDEIFMPVVGAGISISNKSIESHERLSMILDYIKNYNFKKKITVNIIINEDHKKTNYNLAAI